MGQMILLEQELSTRLVPQPENCSYGSFEEGALIFHPPGIPGDHPEACVKCGQAANLDSVCP